LLIAAAQRIEHYEIATYGTAIAWAEAMGHDHAAGLLQETLAEEKAVDERLTRLAMGSINQEAAAIALAAKE
jgi:ferritin-like metal-binding protein YciE